MNKQIIKELIVKYETQANGFNRLSGTGVKVINLKVKKETATADVVLFTDIEAGINERYDKCVYNLKKLFTYEGIR